MRWVLDPPPGVTLRTRTESPPVGYTALTQSTLEKRLEGLRGMAWAYAALYYTNLSAAKASIVFCHHHKAASTKTGDPGNSNIFYQYLRGNRAPKIGPRGKNGFDLVSAVGADPQGQHATVWLRHPFIQAFERHSDFDFIRIRAFRVPEYIKAAFKLVRDTKSYDGAEHCKTLSDFMFACLWFRYEIELVGIKFERRKPSYMLLKRMSEKAAELDPVFRYIRKPFLRMIQDFFVIRRCDIKES